MLSILGSVRGDCGMKTPMILIAAMAMLCITAEAEHSALLHNDFFAFDNGVGRGTWSPEEQATLLAELGYAGIGYAGTEDLELRLAAFKKHGIQIFNLYVPCYVDKTPPYGEDLARAIERLRGTGVDIWLTVQGNADDDKEAVENVRKIADLAAASDLDVVLYPHFGFCVADIEDAVRITQKADRKNVGVTFNLCHELRAGNEQRFGELLEQAAPYLRLVSINGADHEGDWDRLIRPLGEGAFDVYALLKKLQTIGYDGPIGLQCYAVKGDPIENLRKSIAQWILYRARLRGELAKK